MLSAEAVQMNGFGSSSRWSRQARCVSCSNFLMAMGVAASAAFWAAGSGRGERRLGVSLEAPQQDPAQMRADAEGPCTGSSGLPWPVSPTSIAESRSPGNEPRQCLPRIIHRQVRATLKQELPTDSGNRRIVVC
jgi:hypothetical protein